MKENESKSNLPLQSGELRSEVKPNFHNTIHLKGEKLKKGNCKAQSQSNKILDFLRERLNEKFTSCEIRKYLVETGIMPESTQESTIRARLTGLYKQDFVMKLDEMKDGFYGMPNHLWTIKQDIPQVIEGSNIQLDIF